MQKKDNYNSERHVLNDKNVFRSVETLRLSNRTQNCARKRIKNQERMNYIHADLGSLLEQVNKPIRLAGGFKR